MTVVSLRRFFRVLPLVAGLLVAVGASAAPLDPSDLDERAEARQQLIADARRVDELLSQTRRGKNLSDMTLGLFAIHIMNEMSKDDGELFRYLHRDGRGSQGYLEQVFQFHSTEEVAAVEAMAGTNSRRLAVRYALETLRHIPDGKEPFDTQERDRMDLAAALAQLEAALKSAIAEGARQ